MKTLFNNPSLARNTDPITSHIAADKMIESGKLNDQEGWVYDHIWAASGHGTKGVTAKEITHDYNINYYIIQRRLSGLVRKGKIEFLTTEGRWVKILDENNRPATRDGCRIVRAI